MTRLNVFLALVSFVSAMVIMGSPASAQTLQPHGWTGTTQVKPNAYGLGVNADQYGRPHSYGLQNGTKLDPIFNEGVKRDAYGLGVHSDEFGRPVRDNPWPND
jgi:hypothetical protein